MSTSTDSSEPLVLTYEYWSDRQRYDEGLVVEDAGPISALSEWYMGDTGRIESYRFDGVGLVLFCKQGHVLRLVIGPPIKEDDD